MSSSPCAACKFLRRKCTKECEFSPYFPADNPKRFADVHKVFGASNVAKILRDMEASSREDAVQSLAYEAESRLKDPVYGCVGHIYQMQTTLQNLHASLEDHKKVLASIVGPTAMFQMLHDPTLRAMYQPFASSSSNPSMLVLDHQQQYKVQQEQYQRQQQIGAHVMQQCLQQSERQQHHKEQLLERQMQVTEQHKRLHGGAVVIRDANVQFQQIDSKEETPLQFMSYDEIHQQAQMKFLQEQREAELMRLHEHQLTHNAMNPYNVQQQEQQPLLMLQQQPELQQQEQQEIQDLQLFQDHNLYPPEPENGV